MAEGERHVVLHKFDASPWEVNKRGARVAVPNTLEELVRAASQHLGVTVTHLSQATGEVVGRIEDVVGGSHLFASCTRLRPLHPPRAGAYVPGTPRKEVPRSAAQSPRTPQGLSRQNSNGSLNSFASRATYRAHVILAGKRAGCTSPPLRASPSATRPPSLQSAQRHESFNSQREENAEVAFLRKERDEARRGWEAEKQAHAETRARLQAVAAQANRARTQADIAATKLRTLESLQQEVHRLRSQLRESETLISRLQRTTAPPPPPRGRRLHKTESQLSGVPKQQLSGVRGDGAGSPASPQRSASAAALSPGPSELPDGHGVEGDHVANGHADTTPPHRPESPQVSLPHVQPQVIRDASQAASRPEERLVLPQDSLPDEAQGMAHQGPQFVLQEVPQNHTAPMENGQEDGDMLRAGERGSAGSERFSEFMNSMVAMVHPPTPGVAPSEHASPPPEELAARLSEGAMVFALPSEKDALKSGWLSKQAENLLANWNRRYMVATTAGLFYGKQAKEGSPAKFLALDGTSRVVGKGGLAGRHVFELQRGGEKAAFSCSSRQEKMEWTGVIQTIIQGTAPPRSEPEARRAVSSPPPQLPPRAPRSRVAPTAPDENEDPEAKNERKRKEQCTQVIREMVETENTYVVSLRTLQTVFGEPLLALRHADELQIPSVFRDIGPIIGTHALLHSKLSAVVERAREVWEAEVAAVLATMAPFLKQCSPYIDRFDHILGIVKTMSKDKSVQHILQEARKACPHSLEALLILPIQRKLIEHTPASATEHPQLVRALGAIKEVAQHCNRRKQEADSRNKLCSIVTSVKHIPVHLQIVDPSRTFVFEGELQVLYPASQRLQHRHLYLLSDMLLFRDVSTAQTYKGHIMLGPSQARLSPSLMAAHCAILPLAVDRQQLVPHGFVLETADEAFILFASSLEDKRKWVAHLAAVVPCDS